MIKFFGVCVIILNMFKQFNIVFFKMVIWFIWVLVIIYRGIEWCFIVLNKFIFFFQVIQFNLQVLFLISEMCRYFIDEVYFKFVIYVEEVVFISEVGGMGIVLVVILVYWGYYYKFIVGVLKRYQFIG